jgi:hypothetical protein
VEPCDSVQVALDRPTPKVAGAFSEVFPLPTRLVDVLAVPWDGFVPPWVPPAATEQAARVPAATRRTRATNALVG